MPIPKEFAETIVSERFETTSHFISAKPGKTQLKQLEFTACGNYVIVRVVSVHHFQSWGGNVAVDKETRVSGSELTAYLDFCKDAIYLPAGVCERSEPGVRENSKHLKSSNGWLEAKPTRKKRKQDRSGGEINVCRMHISVKSKGVYES